MQNDEWRMMNRESRIALHGAMVLWEIREPVYGHEENAKGVPEQSPGLRSYPGKGACINSNPVRVA